MSINLGILCFLACLLREIKNIRNKPYTFPFAKPLTHEFKDTTEEQRSF